MEIVQKPFFGKFSNFLILAIMFHEHDERADDHAHTW